MPDKIKSVQLFVTCLVDQFYPDVGVAVVDLLKALGLEVTFHLEQTCCGQPAFNGGFLPEAQKMARHTIDLLLERDDPIVVPSGSCGDMIIHRYAEILQDDPVYAPKATAVSQRTYELTQFLVDVLKADNIKASCNGRVTYHASCHGLRGLGLRDQPQKLLSSTDQLVPLTGAEECCGFGGLFAVKMGGISTQILAKKLDHIEATDADILVGGDVSCLMHMAGGLHRRGSKVQVKHIAQLLTVIQEESNS